MSIKFKDPETGEWIRQRTIKGDKGDPGENGKDGATFTPSISDGVLSWSNNGNLENPPDFDFAAISGSFNETDPTVPAWAKQPNKPTYTAAEVGAMPADVEIPIFPEAASIGQTIVVKAVDENGRPTEWEAADLPSGGGSVGMELLTTVTVNEPVTLLTISSCDDGTSFADKKLTRIGVFAKIVGNVDVTTAKPITAKAGGVHTRHGRLPIPDRISSTDKEFSIEFRTIGRQIWMDAQYDFLRLYSSNTVIQGNTANKTFPTIDQIDFFYDGSGYVIPAGSTFEVWGI